MNQRGCARLKGLKPELTSSSHSEAHLTAPSRGSASTSSRETPWLTAVTPRSWWLISSCVSCWGTVQGCLRSSEMRSLLVYGGRTSEEAALSWESSVKRGERAGQGISLMVGLYYYPAPNLAPAFLATRSIRSINPKGRPPGRQSRGQTVFP